MPARKLETYTTTGLKDPINLEGANTIGIYMSTGANWDYELHIQSVKDGEWYGVDPAMGQSIFAGQMRDGAGTTVKRNTQLTRLPFPVYAARMNVQRIPAGASISLEVMKS